MSQSISESKIGLAFKKNLRPSTKYKSGHQRMKDLNMKVKIMKLIEHNREYLCGLQLNNNGLSKTSELQTIRQKRLIDLIT